MSYAKPDPMYGSKTMPPAIAAPPSKWSKYWVGMWIIIAIGLLSFSPFMAFWDWWTAVAIAFGIPEFIGARVQNDAFPPLTHVIVRYVHAEIATPLLFGLTAGIGTYWLSKLPGPPEAWHVGVLFAMLGWFNSHFLLRYVPRRNP